MLTAPGDSSGDCEKQQMEQSQSHGSSGLPYLEDTFESFSEEEEAYWQRESDPPESCSAEGLEGSAVSDEQPEVADSAAAEKDLMGRWIGLITKESGIKQDRSVIKTHAEMSELSDEELDALRSFCTKKISGMHQQLVSKQTNGDKSRKLQPGLTAKKPETSDLSCIVPHGLMNRIRLKNIREAVKQVAEAQIHDPSVCPDCQEKEAELAKITFCKRKKVLMESALIQEKLEEQIYLRDTLTLLGEALGSLPKPSEDPRHLRQRLKVIELQDPKILPWRTQEKQNQTVDHVLLFPSPGAAPSHLPQHIASLVSFQGEELSSLIRTGSLTKLLSWCTEDEVLLLEGIMFPGKLVVPRFFFDKGCIEFGGCLKSSASSK